MATRFPNQCAQGTSNPSPPFIALFAQTALFPSTILLAKSHHNSLPPKPLSNTSSTRLRHQTRIIRPTDCQVAGIHGSRYKEAGSFPQPGCRNLGTMSPLSERSLIFPMHTSTMRAPRQEPSAGPAPDPALRRCEGWQMRDDRRDQGRVETGGRRRKVGERQQVGPPPRAFVMWRKPLQTPFGARAQDNFSIWVKLMTSTLNGLADETSLSGYIQSLQRSQGGTGSRSHSGPACNQTQAAALPGAQGGSSALASPPAQATPACLCSAGTTCTPVSKASWTQHSWSFCTAEWSS